MKLLITISALLLTYLTFAQKDRNLEKSISDSMIFDLSQSNISTNNGTTYIDIPMYIKSNSTVNNFDFWFKYDESKLTYDTVLTTISGLDPFTSFNANNHFLSNTTTGPNSNFIVPMNTTLLTIRFKLLSTCTKIAETDFNSINTLTNGSICNNRFKPNNQIQQIPSIISTNTLYCTNSSYSFSYPSTIFGQNITNYSWDFGNNLVDNKQNTSTSYSTDGDYTIVLVATNSLGCSYTSYKYIHVDISPIASFTSSYNSNNGLATYTNTSTISTGTINQFDWSFGDNLSSQIENPTHTYSSTGNYVVKLIVTSSVGCSDTTSNTITITPMTNSLEENNTSSNVSIYPNPASKSVSIHLKETAYASLFDLSGKQITEQVKIQENNEFTFNLNQFSNGIYLLRIQNDKFYKTYKIEVLK